MTVSAGQMQGVGVYTRTGKSIGRISDLMIDEKSGNVAYIVIASGGFLGIGETRYSLPWADIQFDQAKGNYIVSRLPQEMSANILGVA